MAGRYRRARTGERVRVKGIPVPYTFWPDAYLKHGRIVTSDPWRCLAVHICRTVTNRSKRAKASAFLEQAEDLYHAAGAARVGSKPLLYYYSFLNLAKTLLVVKKGVDLNRCMHGLKEPQENVRRHLTITSQSVVANASNPRGPAQVYREFVAECGFPVPANPRPMKLVDLLEQTVSIHRITSHTLGRARQFFPVHEIAFEFDHTNKEVWVALYVNRDELTFSSTAAGNLRKHTKCFEEVELPKEKNEFRRYESVSRKTYSRSPLDVLRPLVLDTWKDIWSELRPGGYQFWVSSIPAKKRLAQLASGYQAMFYFGSVARYRPDDFRKLVEGKHGWMVQEFINNQPIQFLYFLGSGIIDAEMVIPELVMR